jgi:hypothetical protein
MSLVLAQVMAVVRGCAESQPVLSCGVSLNCRSRRLKGNSPNAELLLGLGNVMSKNLLLFRGKGTGMDQRDAVRVR